LLQVNHISVNVDSVIMIGVVAKVASRTNGITIAILVRLIDTTSRFSTMDYME